MGNGCVAWARRSLESAVVFIERAFRIDETLVGECSCKKNNISHIDLGANNECERPKRASLIFVKSVLCDPTICRPPAISHPSVPKAWLGSAPHAGARLGSAQPVGSARLRSGSVCGFCLPESDSCAPVPDGLTQLTARSHISTLIFPFESSGFAHVFSDLPRSSIWPWPGPGAWAQALGPGPRPRPRAQGQSPGPTCMDMHGLGLGHPNI